MRAMILEQAKTPLYLKELPIPEPKENQILIQVETCAICRTDLHIIDGELPLVKTPLILGHQIVGKVVKLGPKTHRFALDTRVGVPWLGYTCKTCSFCTSGKENLCDKARFTGYHFDGGYAEFCVALEEYCHPIPRFYTSSEVAPLLCGGLIGFRGYRMAIDAKRIGFYGFGSSAHLLIQMATQENKEIYAFTRPGDDEAQTLAKKLGAYWAGSSEELPPYLLDAALIFAPVGLLMPIALKAVRKGGNVISLGIHMSDIPSFSYELLFGERTLTSVSNLTRKDGADFFAQLAKTPIRPNITLYPLEQANKALSDLREGKITGSAVLQVK